MSRDLITFRCPQCQASLSLPTNMAGAAGPCLYCETEIIGPNPEIGQPAQLAAPVTQAPPASAAPTAPTAPTAQGAAAPTPNFTDIIAAPAQAATSASPAKAVAPTQLLQSVHPFPQQEPAPPQQAPAQWDPFAPEASSASPSLSLSPNPKPNPNPNPPQQPAAPSSTYEAQVAHEVPPFSLGDFAAPAPPSAPQDHVSPNFTNRPSLETSTGTNPPASLPPLSRQTNPLSPEPQEHHRQQAQPVEPFGQRQQPHAQPTDPFTHLQPQPQPPFPVGGFPEDPQIPPHPAAPNPLGFGASTPNVPAPQRTWQDDSGDRGSNFPKLPKLPSSEALRDLIEQLRTSPLAPLAIAGTLVVLLIVFGIYLFRDYKEIVPGNATGGAPDSAATSPASATTAPAVDPATAPTSGTPAVDPVTSTTPDTPPAPATPDPAPATATATDPGTAGTTTPPETTIPGVDAPGSLLDGPIATLQAFVSAATWQERIEYALYPEVVKPLMEIYYRNYPDEAVVPESIRFQHSETDPDTGKQFFVFHVTTEDAPDGFPVLIEETSDGLKVDWETFVEFRDNLFQRFCNNPSPGKLGAFHLIMRNAHYFGEEFPELKDLTPYRLDPPIPNQETYAFALTDSIVNKDLQKQVTWGMNFTPFLELRWAKSQNGTDYLQAVSVLHTNWRNRTP